MTHTLTTKAIDALKPQARPYEMGDAQFRGLRLRVYPSGAKAWSVLRRLRKGAKPTRIALGRYPDLSLSDARVQAASKVAAGQPHATMRNARTWTVGDAVSAWLDADQTGNRTHDAVAAAVELHFVRHFEGVRVQEITQQDLKDRLREIVGTGAATQANRVFAYLRRLFGWLASEGYISASPIAQMNAPAREASRERALSITELGKVWCAAETLGCPWKAFIRTLILTGQRRGEVSGMMWSELDFASRTWTLSGARTKNGRPHAVHLADATLLELQGLPRFADSDLVFTTNGLTPISGFSKIKATLVKASGVSDWTLHDLRRSFATITTERLNVSSVVIDRVLNHVSGTVKGVAAVYQRGQYLDQRRSALTHWAEFVSGLDADKADEGRGAVALPRLRVVS